MAKRSLDAIPGPAAAGAILSVGRVVRLIASVDAINGTDVLGEAHELGYTLYLGTSEITIYLLDRATKRVLGQVPPWFVLQIAESLRARPAPLAV